MITLDAPGYLSYASSCGSASGKPADGAQGRHDHCTRYGAKGAGQMRTLRELESDIEIENDPMGDTGSLDPGSLEPDD